jgi:protein-S-isoprenylcysteine O-methyltransferase Ste14
MTDPPNEPSQSQVSDRLRTLIFGRFIPGILFALLALNTARVVLPAWQTAFSEPNFLHIVWAVRATLYLMFVGALVFIYVGRPAPRARDGSFAARLAAFGATFLLVVVLGLLPSGPQLYQSPPWGEGLALLVQAFAYAGGVASYLYLRSNFSIVPEARNLVTTGPYALVRNPLYFIEIVSMISLIFNNAHLVPLLAFALFVPLQLWRVVLEERLLRRVFPAEYDAYAAHTPRLLPGVW